MGHLRQCNCEDSSIPTTVLYSTYFGPLTSQLSQERTNFLTFRMLLLLVIVVVVVPYTVPPPPPTMA